MIGAVLLAAGLSGNGARAIDVALRERPVWAALDLPQQIDPGANGGYDDLRIVDDRGEETPYVLDPQCASIPTRSVAVSDVGFVPGRYTEALLDSGTSSAQYSGVSIGTTNDTYFDRVDVAISDDRVTWREVRRDALIYRVADSGDPGTQTISITPARARWIRVRVHDPRAPFAIDSAVLDAAQSAVPRALKRLAASSRTSWHDDDRTSIITLDTGTPHTALSLVRIRTPQAEFSRDVTLFASDDAVDWSYAGTGTIQRFAHGEPQLDVPAASQARYVRIDIANGSDAPLPELSAEAFGPRRIAVFVARPGRTYALTRLPRARAPEYDLSRLIERDDPRSFAVAQLAGTYVVHRSAPSAISQPLVLTLAFAASFLALGAVTLATLRPRTAPLDEERTVR
jgi:hypothetical protein